MNSLFIHTSLTFVWSRFFYPKINFFSPHTQSSNNTSRQQQQTQRTIFTAPFSARTETKDQYYLRDGLQSKVSNINAARRRHLYPLAAAAAAVSFVSPLRSSSHSVHDSEVFNQNHPKHHPAGKANCDARSIWVQKNMSPISSPYYYVPPCLNWTSTLLD